MYCSKNGWFFMKLEKKKETIFNNYKEAFEQSYEHIEKISDYLKSLITLNHVDPDTLKSLRPLLILDSKTFRRLKYLADCPMEVDNDEYNYYQTVYNVISPKEEEIANFANEHLFFLELPENPRIKNISVLNTTLVPIVQQLKQILKAYVPDRLLNAGVKKVVKKVARLKGTTAKIGKLHFKPTDSLTKPTKQTAETLKQASALYGEVLVKPEFVKSNPLIDSMKTYKQIKLLKVTEDAKIKKNAEALIEELEGYSTSSETIVSSIIALDGTVKRAKALSAKVKKQNALSAEAVSTAQNNSNATNCSQKK